MLYEQWKKVALRNPGTIALRCLATGRQWTFGELANEAESLPRTTEPWVFPTGGSAEFILETLRGWRDQRIVCPLEDATNHPVLHDLPPEIKHVKMTSGTSGTSRLVAFTEAQLAADAGNIIETMHLSPESPNLAAVSLAHSYGYSNLVLPLLLAGVPLVIASSPLPDSLRRALVVDSNWTLPAVPALWQAWFTAEAISGGIRMAVSAGAPLPIALENEVHKKLNLKIHNFLGSSECGGIAFDRTHSPRTDASLVGTALEQVQVTTSSDGRLCVRSAAVASTYWPTPEETLGQGRFELSDYGEIRDTGIHLTGRVGEQINIAGRKISPESIEQALLLYPNLRECLVFGIPSENAERHEEIVAVIVGHPGTIAELRHHLDALLPAWNLPKHWHFVDSLNTNTRGKTSRTEWRTRFLSTRNRHPGG